jgi:hypothetical protein
LDRRHTAPVCICGQANRGYSLSSPKSVEMAFFVSKAKIEAFAAEMSQSVVTRYPPELVNDQTRRPSEVRLTRIVEDVCQRAVDFRDQERLGWARLDWGTHSAGR